MKFEFIDRFEVFDSVKEDNYCSFEYASVDIFDILFVGMKSGKIQFHIQIASRSTSKNSRPVDASRESPHKGPITCLIFSKSVKLCGKSKGFLISGSTDRTIKIWNLTINGTSNSGTNLIQTVYGHEGSLSALVDGQDGTILSSSVDGTIRVWSPQIGRHLMSSPFFENILTFRTQQPLNGTVTPTWFTCLVVDSTRIWNCFAADMNGGVEIYRKALNESLPLVSSTATTSISRFRRLPAVHDLGIITLAYMSLTNFLITTSYDCSCKVSDGATGQSFFTITNQRNHIYTGLLCQASASRILLSDYVGYFELWDIQNGQQILMDRAISRLEDTDVKSSLKVSRAAQDAAVFSTLSMHRKQRHFWCLLPQSGIVTKWKICRQLLYHEFLGHDNCPVIHVATRPYESEVSDNTDAVVGSELSDIEEKDGSNLPLSFQISAEEQLLFSTSADNVLLVWDDGDSGQKKNDALLRQFRGKGLSEMVCATMLWGLNLTATGHEDGTLCLWNCDNGKRVSWMSKSSTSNGGDGSSSSSSNALLSLCDVFISGQKRVLLGSDASGRIMIFNLSTLRYYPGTIPVDRILLKVHNAANPVVRCLTYHPQLQIVFSGGQDTTIRAWRLNSPSGSEVVVNTLHTDAVTVLKCEGEFLLSGDDSGIIYLWRLSSDQSSPGNRSVSSFSYDPSAKISKVYESSCKVINMVALCRWKLDNFGGIRSASIAKSIIGEIPVIGLSTAIIAFSCSACQSFIWEVQLVPVGSELLFDTMSLVSASSSLSVSKAPAYGMEHRDDKSISTVGILSSRKPSMIRDEGKSEWSSGREDEDEEEMNTEGSTGANRVEVLVESVDISNVIGGASTSKLGLGEGTDGTDIGIGVKAVVTATLLYNLNHDDVEPTTTYLISDRKGRVSNLYVGFVNGTVIKYSL